jgi:hypothetical protein
MSLGRKNVVFLPIGSDQNGFAIIQLTDQVAASR